MTREEKALIYFKDLRERKVKDYSSIFDTAPKDSVVYEAVSAEIEIYDTTIKALEQLCKDATIDKHHWKGFNNQPKEKESATVAKFHDFYPEDPATWPPADKEILVKNHVGDNLIAYLEYDDGEDGGWGFYSEDGDFIADVNDISAWMPIPQHERDKDYIPVWEREKKTIPAEIHEGMDEDTEEEKDR